MTSAAGPHGPNAPDGVGNSEPSGVDDTGAAPADADPTIADSVDSPARPFTLAIDIGGTGLKASVLDANGAMVAKRVRVPTRYPMPPTGDGGLVATLVKLVSSLPQADRVSAGFPGMVRGGLVLSAPHFSTESGPGSSVDDHLLESWSRFDLARELGAALRMPAKVANDADVQGLAVVSGIGLEFVVTLGTGFGTATFMDGGLLPHLELAHHQFRKGQTYNEQLGEAARKEIGDHRWNTRVRKAVAALDALMFFDHLYIGGGNARRVIRDQLGDQLARTTIVDNSAGILGGIKLWSRSHVGV